MNAEQLEMVRDAKQGRPFESWFYIYRVLFPEDREPASPYAEWVTGDDLRTFFQGVLKRLPVLLYQAAVKIQPQAAGARPSRTDLFPTSAEIVQQALLYCQKEFGESRGLSHVFASVVTSPTSSIAGSIGSDRANTPASRIKPDPEQQAARQARHATQRTMQVEEEEDDESDSSSITEMSVDEQPRHSRHSGGQQSMQHGRESYHTAVTNTGYPSTTNSGPTSAYTTVQAPYNLEDELYRQFGTRDDPEDEWSH